MNIYTTYYANIKNLPEDMVVVPVSLVVPDQRYRSMRYYGLVPTWDMLVKIHKDHGVEDYTKYYKELILGRLDPHRVYNDLERMSGGRDVALCCFEGPNKFCHRHIIAEWLTYSGYSVGEWKKTMR